MLIQARLILLCFILLSFIDTVGFFFFVFFFFVFLELSVHDNPESSKSTIAIFQYLSFHVSPSYFGNSHNSANFHLYYICYGDLWSVIFADTTTTH